LRFFRRPPILVCSNEQFRRTAKKFGHARMKSTWSLPTFQSFRCSNRPRSSGGNSSTKTIRGTLESKAQDANRTDVRSGSSATSDNQTHNRANQWSLNFNSPVKQMKPCVLTRVYIRRVQRHPITKSVVRDTAVGIVPTAVSDVVFHHATPDLVRTAQDSLIVNTMIVLIKHAVI